MRHRPRSARVSSTVTVASWFVLCFGVAERAFNSPGGMNGALGPLTLRAHSPATILRLSPTPEAPSLAAPGSWRVAELVSWTNYFDYDPERYIIDAEAVRFATRIAYGASHRLELGLELPFSHRGGGVLDATIERFHRAFSLSNGQRETQPRNQYRVWIKGSNGRPDFELRDENAGWGAEDLIASARFCLLGECKASASLVATAMVKLPSVRTPTLYTTGGLDVGGSLSAAKGIGRTTFYGMAAAMRYGETSEIPLALNRWQYSAFAGVEYSLSPRTSLLLQLLGTSPTADGFGDFGRWSLEAALGFKRRLWQRWFVEFGIIENLLIYDNSPDVGVHLGLTWRQRPLGAASRWGAPQVVPPASVP